jgi:NarL family two-component system response regulator LiaR
MMGKSQRIRVLIVDDHAVVRQGLRTFLGMLPDIQIVGEAASGADAVAAQEKAQPDVILMDLVMPEMDGVEATRRIRSARPDAKIIVLTSFAEEDKIFPAIRAGALGYLLKDSSPEQLLRAIRDVHRGEPSLHPTIALKMIRELDHPASQERSASPLTDREIQVLKLVAQGLTNQEIADRLVISEWTVRTHVRNILGKLHLANRTQATLYALREGLAKS